LLEHDALALLSQHGIAVAPYRVAATAAEAREAAQALGARVVVKALVPAGGRGKAGAVRRCGSAEEAEAAGGALLGMAVGRFPVERVLVSEALDIAREFFVSVTFDSMRRAPLLLFTAEGGVDVETLLAEAPGKLLQEPVDLLEGLPPYAARALCRRAGLSGRLLVEMGEALAALYRLFRATDARVVEVNPLALTGDGRLVAASAMVNVDDQALFRHPELGEAADPDRSNGWRPLTPLEREMRAIDRADPRSAIRFNEFEDGDVGMMMTGGGSGLLSLDALLGAGGRPATTFDITAGDVEEKMYLATRAVLLRPGLRGLIVGGNISNFIPIDVKVRGVVRAIRELGIDPRRFPVVFRFAGPNVEVARELAASLPGVEFYDEAASIEDAVRRIAARTREVAP
jgi:succinyl-CoA synthetase beta subunit/citryl-CoA synthetase large subunit